jgi:hypothetical protein
MVLKNINIHLGYLTGTIISGTLTWMTLQGTLQTRIHFAGVLNEIGFAMAGALLTIACAALTFSRGDKDC